MHAIKACSANVIKLPVYISSTVFESSEALFSRKRIFLENLQAAQAMWPDELGNLRSIKLASFYKERPR